VREGGFSDRKGAVNVRIHDPIEAGRIEIGGVDVLVDARVVHDVRDVAERVGRPRNESRRGLEIAYVRADDDRLPAGLAYPLGDPFCRALGFDLVDPDVVAGRGDWGGKRAAKSARGTGDDRCWHTSSVLGDDYNRFGSRPGQYRRRNEAIRSGSG
jgi:hypothetical protein